MINIGNKKIKNIYIGNKKVASAFFGNLKVYSSGRLPSEYQEVEYLQSTGTQWIDTGLAPSNNYELNMKISPTQIVTQIINGVGTNNEGQINLGYYTSFNKLFTQCNTPYITNNEPFIVNNEYLINVKIKDGEYSLDVNNNKVSGTSTVYSTNSTFYLFAYHTTFDNGAIHRSYIKLYSLEWYNNEVLVRDFVPCYRKADNKPGLYDLVNDVFYTNAGTDEFTVGADVND